jgi:hypothetical protein
MNSAVAFSPELSELSSIVVPLVAGLFGLLMPAEAPRKADGDVALTGLR